MTIKNTSSKIISIGKTVLLPDDTMEVSEVIANAPVIKAMAGRGQLSIKGDRKAKPAAVAEDTTAAQEESSDEKSGDGDEKKKPLSRMGKSELIAECQRLGIEVGPDDTNPMMVEKIKAATAE